MDLVHAGKCESYRCHHQKYTQTVGQLIASAPNFAILDRKLVNYKVEAKCQSQSQSRRHQQTINNFENTGAVEQTWIANVDTLE